MDGGGQACSPGAQTERDSHAVPNSTQSADWNHHGSEGYHAAWRGPPYAYAYALACLLVYG